MPKQKHVGVRAAIEFEYIVLYMFVKAKYNKSVWNTEYYLDSVKGSCRLI